MSRTVVLPHLLRRANGLLGSVILLAALSFTLVGLLWTPYDPIEPDFLSRLQPPGAVHWLGTDEWGRDVLSRILAGARTSVFISLCSVSFALFFGALIGAVSGFFGGWTDRVIMMLTDALLAFPGLLMALAFMAILGPSKWGVIFALGLAYVPTVIRLMRGSVLSVREREFVEASRAVGDSRFYTLVMHIIPNCMAPLIIMATALFGYALLAESALSFLGLGVPPPEPTWGNMLSESRGEFAMAPWLAIFPGLFISVTLLGINLFGDALRDIFDPRMRQTGDQR
ncbi:ABC transporter permease [Ponticoccus alexandrii]|uniref:ABC transporter permease subunit n=1 Tax=Ponticoccus alexandrii TaxID=1943633 RepID=A0ABX7FG18_9RHOB|nr:ABC transporter permease [Ponticoccus alexandrii]ETA49460.2 peptide ABC transporter permease [Rhodobacteraceae bacterium PD-2]QRF69409.1 ABC transporter permease subunit [Ponticoccus alexandrii]